MRYIDTHIEKCACFYMTTYIQYMYQLCSWIYNVLSYSVDYIKLYCHVRNKLRISSEFSFRLQK